MHRSTRLFAIAILFSTITGLAAADWPHRGGPGANGVAPDTTLPVRWSATDNIALRTDDHLVAVGKAGAGSR